MLLTALCAVLGAGQALVAGQAAAADLANGRQVYEEHCAMCHGRDGRPLQPQTPDFSRSEGLLTGDSAILASVRRGVRLMPGYDGLISERGLVDVVAYLRTLQR